MQLSYKQKSEGSTPFSPNKKNSNLITRYSNILKCTILGQKLGG